jgi:hypothetical protein
MSAVATAAETKGQKMAREMAEQLGGIAVKSGTGGLTLVTKAEGERPSYPAPWTRLPQRRQWYDHHSSRPRHRRLHDRS